MKKGIITIIISAIFALNTNIAKAQIPTTDFGNLAGTIGIVTQGITNVQQGVDSIKNASKFLAVVGDSVGTITKFADKIKGYVGDAQAAIEKAKKRISEGMELYNKYKGEIEDRKAKYQALLASVPDYTNPNSYNDGSSSDGSSANKPSTSSSSSNSGGQSSPVANSTSSQNYGGSAIVTPSAGRTVAPATGPVNSSSVNNSRTTNQTAAPAASRVTNQVAAPAAAKVSTTAAVAPQTTGFRTTPQNPVATPAATKVVSPSTSSSKALNTPVARDNILQTRKDLPTTVENKASLFEEEDEPEDLDTSKEKAVEKANPETESVGRKAFSSPITDVATTKSAQTSAKDAISAPETSKSSAETNSSKVSETVAAPVSSKAGEATSAEITAPEAVSAPASTGFRQSPTTVEKRSQTLHYTSRLDFASEMNNSTKGSGYDKNGMFIFNVKYCDKSVDEMMTEKGTRECLVNIVNKINDDNAHFAIENKADCQKMVFDTAVALLAEAINMLKEASNYQDTLDEQGQLGGNSNNTRDDTQVLAMNYEQTQLLLNRLTVILSGETILNVTKDICEQSRNVLEENEVETSSGGK